MLIDKQGHILPSGPESGVNISHKIREAELNLIYQVNYAFLIKPGHNFINP
jgi:hypothetical protein